MKNNFLPQLQRDMSSGLENGTSNKTAMQEMLLNIESIELKTTDQEQIYMLTALKIAALVLLQKEKEQIMRAWYNGFDELRPFVDHSEEYYNKTYNQNK